METKTLDVFWQSFFSFLENIGLIVIPLFAVYLGWRLSQKTYIKQLLLDTLKWKFDALRKVKKVIEEIPPNLNKKELHEKLSTDPPFLKGLTDNMDRLFGLRNELIPFLEPELIDLIDNSLRPLYIKKNGGYIFRKDKIDEFVAFADKAKLQVTVIEEWLTQEYKNQLK